MIDINRVVEFATIQGYFISDLYKAIGIKKAGFLNIRKNKSCQFRIDYFYNLCNYLGIEIKEGLEIFDEDSTIDFKKYVPEYNYNILENRSLRIEELIRYAHSKGLYIKDLAAAIEVDTATFRKLRKNENEFKKYFFKISEFIGVPYGKAIAKYTMEIIKKI